MQPPALNPSQFDSLYPTTYSTFKTYGFIVVMILGVGGLVVAGMGLSVQQGWWQTRILSQPIVMLAAGSTGGVVLFAIGIIGVVKNRHPHGIESREEGAQSIAKSASVKSALGTALMQKPVIYGSDEWNHTFSFAIIADSVVPPMPHVPWDQLDPYFNEPFQNNYVLIYIPGNVSVNGSIQQLSFVTLARIDYLTNYADLASAFFPPNQPLKAHDQSQVVPGWRLMSKRPIPTSPGTYQQKTQALVATSSDFHLPHLIEASVLVAFEMRQRYRRPVGHTLIACCEHVQGAPVTISNLSNKICFGLGSQDSPKRRDNDYNLFVVKDI